MREINEKVTSRKEIRADRSQEGESSQTICGSVSVCAMSSNLSVRPQILPALIRIHSLVRILVFVSDSRKDFTMTRCYFS